METHFGGGYRDPQRLGNFVVGPSVDIFEDDHRPLGRVEVVEGGRQFGSEFDGLPGVFRIDPVPRIRRLRGLVESLGGVPVLSLLEGPSHIDGDPVKPRRKRGIAPEIGERPPRSDKRLLGDVGSKFAIYDQSQGQTKYLMLMSLYQLLEGLAAALLGSSNKRFDVVRFDHLRLHRVTFFA